MAGGGEMDFTYMLKVPTDLLTDWMWFSLQSYFMELLQRYMGISQCCPPSCFGTDDAAQYHIIGHVWSPSSFAFALRQT